MKILLLVPEFPPDSIGGGGVVFEALCEEYRSQHKVRVVAGATRPRVVGPRDAELHVLRIGEPALPSSLRYLSTTLPPTPRGLWRLLRAVRDADVVHAHGFGFPVVDIGIRLARRRGIPVVQTLHGYPVSQDKRGGWVTLAFEAYAAASGVPALRAATSHTCVSEAVATFYQDHFALDCHVVPNGVALPDPGPWPELSEWRDPARQLVVGVGRLEWIKGFDLLIEAVGSLPDAHRPQVLVVGADHGEGSRLRQLAHERGLDSLIWLPGAQPRDRVATAYQEATCAVVSSHTEAFPAVPLEAMLSGLPLVTSRLPGIASYSVEGENCLAFDIGDPRGLASALTQVLGDEALRLRLSEAGRRTAAAHSWTAVAAQYGSLMTDALGPNGQP